MKSTILVVFLLLIAGCKKNDSVCIVDKEVNKLITDFINDVPNSFLYSGEKVITVGTWYKPKEKVYYISLRNYVPANCEDIVGMNHLSNGFKIYFVILDEVPTFLEIKRRVKCDISEKRQLVPFPEHFTEMFFCYSKEASKIIECND